MNDIQRASQPAALSIPSSPTSAFTVDDVYKAIADGLLAFDLYNDDISEAHRAYVYRDAAALEFYQRIEQGRTHDTMQQLAVSIEVGTEIEYEEHTYRVVLAGQDKVILSGESGNSELSIETLRRLYDENKLTIRASHAVATSECDFHSLSPDELNKALKRARLLEQAALTPDVLPVSKRTLQRYRKAMREVGSSAIEQHLALVPKTKEQRQPTTQDSPRTAGYYRAHRKDGLQQPDQHYEEDRVQAVRRSLPGSRNPALFRKNVRQGGKESCLRACPRGQASGLPDSTHRLVPEARRADSRRTTVPVCSYRPHST
jgi:hypothetical protein